MFTGFNLTINNYDFLYDASYYYSGLNIYNKSKTNVCSHLEQIINKDIIDGDTLQNLYFPTEILENKGFVFISHSHNDEKLAISLAGYLDKKFNVLSFIDSCVWGYMDELNKILNNCSKIKSGYCYSCQCNAFSYNLSYVHMMLASALMTMIDKCECVFFLNTPSSINLNNKTESPWIYYELNIANIIQKISRIQKATMEGVLGYIQKIEFTPNLKKMIKIDEEILRKWENEYNSSDVNPFLALYKICGGVD